MIHPPSVNCDDLDISTFFSVFFNFRHGADLGIQFPLLVMETFY